MPVNLARLRTTLQAFDWKPMFIEVLKWSRPAEHAWSVMINGQGYTLTPVAQMAEMYVYICTSDSHVLPIKVIRRQIENQVKERRFEHIVIFEDGDRQEAVLQWIKRGQGAARSREFTYRRGQNGDLLLQRLRGIALLDRLLHHAEIISINGRSYRMRERMMADVAERPAGVGQK